MACVPYEAVHCCGIVAADQRRGAHLTNRHWLCPLPPGYADAAGMMGGMFGM